MDKELPISPWPEWKIVSKIGEGSFGRVYKAQRTEKGRSFYSAIKIITIPASKGELDSVRSESGDEKSVRGYFGVDGKRSGKINQTTTKMLFMCRE